MKFFKFFSLFCILLFKVDFGEAEKPKFSSALTSAYEENSGTQYLTLTIKSPSSFVFLKNTKLFLKIENDDLPLMTFYELPSLTLWYFETTTIDLPIPTHLYFEHRFKAHIILEYDMIFKVEIEIDFCSFSPQEIKINELESQKYVQEKVCFQIIDNKVIYQDEEFNFSSFHEELILPHYYRLDLDSFILEYLYHLPFKYESAFLSFEDPDNLFPLVDEKSEEIKELELKINKLGDNHMFLSFSPLYVEENYHWASNTFKEGLLSTSYFYLPLNKQEEIYGKNFTLILKGLGETKNDYYFDFAYYFENNLFGSCQTSDYCLSGGVY
ncbi:MAG: hypothetical protein RBR85_01020 [Bacilli bacterium]|jgi:hypothetical protein|nr:hypothetical protein [Bacilli bacterium]